MRQQKGKSSKKDDFATPRVYSVLIKLTRQFEASTKNSPRVYRYGKIDEVTNMLIDLLVNTCSAYNETDAEKRLIILNRTLQIYNNIKVSVRVLHDLRCFGDKGFAAIILLEGDIEKQLNSWLNSEKSKLKNQ